MSALRRTRYETQENPALELADVAPYQDKSKIHRGVVIVGVILYCATVWALIAALVIWAWSAVFP